MAIIEISREEFDSYNPVRMGPVGIFYTEKTWYADTDKNIIGSVIQDNTDKDWNYLVLGRHEDDSYRFLAGDVSKDSFNASKELLFSTMDEMDSTGNASDVLVNSNRTLSLENSRS
jgi:hypothetical protein